MPFNPKKNSGIILWIAISGLSGCGFDDSADSPTDPASGSVLDSRIAPDAKAVQAPAASSFEITNDIPARLQWNANNGYCGEVAFINAGLYYGQYLSQYDIRAIASPNKTQNLVSAQLLLGVNDTFAATQLHLNATPWKTSNKQSSSSFLTWVKSNVISKYPVIIGVYTNEYKFNGTTNVNAGDTDYDHIVTVIGVTSKTALNNPATYYGDDVLRLIDHGIWTGTSNNLPQYTFNYPFSSFQGTRQQANASTAPVYTLPLGNSNFGIAITGVTDLDGSTVPVRLATSANSESPSMKDGSTTRPASKPLTLTITVSNLKPNVSYNLYRYSSVTSVPNSGFNKNASRAFQTLPVKISSGSTFVTKMTINSNEIAIFRAVPSTAP
jgi:hypothetical protein